MNAGVRRGVVVEFDDPRGLGVVSSADGGEAFPFHCTSIADGTRTIPVGVEVVFRVVAGHSGRWEAAEVTANRRTDASA